MKKTFDDNRYYRMSDLVGKKDSQPLLPVGRSTIWQWVSKGAFPKPKKLGDKVTAWRGIDLNDWENQH